MTPESALQCNPKLLLKVQQQPSWLGQQVGELAAQVQARFKLRLPKPRLATAVDSLPTAPIDSGAAAAAAAAGAPGPSRQTRSSARDSSRSSSTPQPPATQRTTLRRAATAERFQKMGQEVTIALEATDAAELGRLLVPGHYKTTPQLNRLDPLAQQLPKSVVWFNYPWQGLHDRQEGQGQGAAHQLALDEQRARKVCSSTRPSPAA